MSMGLISYRPRYLFLFASLKLPFKTRSFGSLISVHLRTLLLRQVEGFDFQTRYQNLPQWLGRFDGVAGAGAQDGLRQRGAEADQALAGISLIDSHNPEGLGTALALDGDG